MAPEFKTKPDVVLLGTLRHSLRRKIFRKIGQQVDTNTKKTAASKKNTHEEGAARLLELTNTSDARIQSAHEPRESKSEADTLGKAKEK